MKKKSVQLCVLVTGSLVLVLLISRIPSLSPTDFVEKLIAQQSPRSFFKCKPGTVVVGQYSDLFKPWREQVSPPRLGVSDASQIAAAKQIIDRELLKYNDKFLKGNIFYIFICKSFNYNNTNFSGTQDGNNIWIVVPSDKWSESDKNEVSSAIHHEFAAMLFGRKVNDKIADEWISLVPQSNMYLGNPFVAIQSGLASTAPNQAKWPAGFFADYAQSSFEKDFCVLWQAAYMSESTLIDAMRSSPIIRRKVALLQQFVSLFPYGSLPDAIIKELAEP